MSKKIITSGLYCALGTAAYIALVALLMSNANNIFGKMPGVMAFIPFLLLFVVSAAITGSLVLGKPLMMYIDGSRKEAVKLFLTTISWLIVLLVIFLTILVIK